MNVKRPMIKETVGAQYYAFNTPTEDLKFDPKTYEETIKTETVKKIGTTENAESTPVIASGKDYKTVSQTSSIDIEVEVIAFDTDDLAKMRAENVDVGGLISSGASKERPFFAYGKTVKKTGGGIRYDWYPKCQLIENTDDIETKEDKFKEQNDTVKIRAYAFDEEGNFKNYVDSEAKNFPKTLTEEKFFTKPIITKEDLAKAVLPEPEGA